MKVIVLIDFFNKALKWGLAGLMLGMLICTLWQVVVRFLLTSFGLPISAPWTEELARYFMIWIIFLGGAIACRHAQLISLEIIVHRLPASIGKSVRYLALMVCVAFFALMANLGLEFLEFGSIETSPVMGIPKNWVYWAMPVGFAVMIMNTLCLLLESWINRADIRYAGQSQEVQ